MSPKHTDYQLGFTALDIILVVALMATIGATGYFAVSAKNSSPAAPKPTPQPISYQRTTSVPGSWKLFADPKHHLTFSYAPNWQVVADSKGNPDQYDYEIGIGMSSQNFDVGIIGIKALPLQSEVAQYKTGYLKFNKLLSEKAITIDGNPAEELRIDNNNIIERQYFIFAHGNTYEPPVVEENDTSFTITAKDSLTLFESIKIN